MRSGRARRIGYYVVRGVAAAGFVASATLLPRGTAAGLLCIAFGVVGVLSCIGVNAGSSAERAGARAQHRAIDRYRAPQGDWPPYEVDDRPHDALPGPSGDPGRPDEQRRRGR